MKSRWFLWLAVVLVMALSACSAPATMAPAAPAAPTAPAAAAPTAAPAAVATTAPAPAATSVPAEGSAAAPTAAAANKFAGTTITMIDNPEGQSDAMLALEKQCQEQTGIKLNVEVVPQDQVNVKLETSLANKGSNYDLFGIDIIDLPKYAAAGWVTQLDPFITPEMQADALPFAKEGATYQGHWYGLPWKAEWLSFVYNKDMLKQAGFDQPPATWDDLIKMSQALKEKKIVDFPIAFTWGAGYEQITVDWTMMVKSLGGQLFDEQGSPAFNQGAGVQALQMMSDMVNKYKIADPAALTLKGGGTRVDLMTGGKAAFGWLWGTPLVNMNDPAKSPRAGQFAVAMSPKGPDGQPVTISGPMGLSITAFSKNKDASWAFLQCLAGPQGEKFMFMQEGAVSGWQSVLRDADVAAKLDKAGGATMKQQGESLAVRPALPYYSEWSSAVQQMVQKVVSGQEQVQPALDSLASQTKQLQSKFGSK